MEREIIIAKARAIQARVDRGVDGEVANAQAALERFLERHSLTLEDLERVRIQDGTLYVDLFVLPKAAAGHIDVHLEMISGDDNPILLNTTRSHEDYPALP